MAKRKDSATFRNIVVSEGKKEKLTKDRRTARFYEECAAFRSSEERDADTLIKFSIDSETKWHEVVAELEEKLRKAKRLVEIARNKKDWTERQEKTLDVEIIELELQSVMYCRKYFIGSKSVVNYDLTCRESVWLKLKGLNIT